MTYNGELCFSRRAAVNKGLSSGERQNSNRRERDSVIYPNIFVLVTKCSLELSVYTYSDTHRHAHKHMHTHTQTHAYTHTNT